MNDKASGFEERLAAVQDIISAIEEQQLPLEESVAKYEEGMKLLTDLDHELKEVCQRLTVIRANAEGEISEESMVEIQ